MILILIFINFSIRYTHCEEWTIHVYTGTERFAGTDSSVFIRLFNLKYGFTSEYELSHENWIIGDKLFPFKNLFEHGEHDRFRISIEKFEQINNIYVRHDSFILIRSDWFLDRIVVERNRDSMKYIFKCNCWFRKDQTERTIPVSSDLQSIEKKNNSLKDNGIIVIIIIIGSISLITCFICSFREYCRRRQFLSIQIQYESRIIYNNYLQLPSAPSILNNTRNFEEEIAPELPPYPHISSVINPINEPLPSYKDLFPD